jgi:transcriptional regulator with XRE-family HTH domain
MARTAGGDIGRRIKRVRQESGLTLKAVESASGVSATHISEIERGATSPTIGALFRIARALGKRPAFFLEENEIGDVSLVTGGDRVRETASGGGATVERLTSSIPGGCVQVCRITLSAGRSHRDGRHTHDGAEAILVVSGRVRALVGDRTVELAEGDAVHFSASQPHAYVNASGDTPAVLLWVASRRDVS